MMRAHLRSVGLIVVLATVLLFAGGVCSPVLAQSQGAAAAAGPPIDDTKIALDTVWTLICAFLVFFMAIGFAMVESGFCRAKNTANILAKNVVVFAAASLAFLALGFGLMFGDGNGFWGYSAFSHWFVTGPDNSPYTDDAYRGIYGSISWTGVPLVAKFFFQLVFAATAATIVSGAVAERIRFGAFYLFGFIMAALFYPITGHWIWGGGWLAEYGMWDFAGSTVVHSVGGWAALSGAIMLGPRLGKYSADGRINPIPGHSLTSGTLGVFILWFGWFGFNPGSTMAADWNAIAHIATTTNTAAATAAVVASLAAWLLLGKPDLTMILNGALAGLVAITAPCAFVSVWPSSVLIGLVAGVLVVVSVLFFDRIRLDDPVGAVSVHLTCGVWGTLAVGLFAQDAIAPGTTGNGLLFGGGGALLGAQAVGVLAVGAFTVAASFTAWGIIKMIIGLRVSAEEEMEGLDLGEHGLHAYADFVITGITERPAAIAAVRAAPVAAATTRGVRTPPVPSKTQRVPPQAADGRAGVAGGRGPARLVVENVERQTLRAIWEELCHEPRERSPQDFKDLYAAVSAFRDGRFILRGDDPQRYKDCLQSLLYMYGVENPQVRVERGEG